MQVNIGTLVLEMRRGFVYAKAGGKELFVKLASGFPLRPQAVRHEDGSREVWGLGLYAAMSRA